jgi:hypothetical protein
MVLEGREAHSRFTLVRSLEEVVRVRDSACA